MTIGTHEALLPGQKSESETEQSKGRPDGKWFRLAAVDGHHDRERCGNEREYPAPEDGRCFIVKHCLRIERGEVPTALEENRKPCNSLLREDPEETDASDQGQPKNKGSARPSREQKNRSAAGRSSSDHDAVSEFLKGDKREQSRGRRGNPIDPSLACRVLRKEKQDQ